MKYRQHTNVSGMVFTGMNDYGSLPKTWQKNLPDLSTTKFYKYIILHHFSTSNNQQVILFQPSCNIYLNLSYGFVDVPKKTLSASQRKTTLIFLIHFSTSVCIYNSTACNPSQNKHVRAKIIWL